MSDALRRQKQTGLYLQDLVEIDNWNLSVGLRQDWYDVSIDDEIAGQNDSQGEKLSGHAGVLYAFDNGVSPYVSYSTSFNRRPTTPAVRRFSTPPPASSGRPVSSSSRPAPTTSTPCRSSIWKWKTSTPRKTA